MLGVLENEPGNPFVGHMGFEPESHFPLTLETRFKWRSRLYQRPKHNEGMEHAVAVSLKKFRFRSKMTTVQPRKLEKVQISWGARSSAVASIVSSAGETKLACGSLVYYDGKPHARTLSLINLRGCLSGVVGSRHASLALSVGRQSTQTSWTK